MAGELIICIELIQNVLYLSLCHRLYEESPIFVLQKVYFQKCETINFRKNDLAFSKTDLIVSVRAALKKLADYRHSHKLLIFSALVELTQTN